MGYDVTLKIGRLFQPTPEHKRHKEPVIDGNSLYYPYEEDEKGEWIPTGREERFHMTDISVDLCVIGNGPLMKLVNKSKVKTKKPKLAYKWYGSNGCEEEEDSYGDKWSPVEIEEVIKALEEELETEDYRRFRWALGLLKAMKEDAKDMVVMFEGH